MPHLVARQQEDRLPGRAPEHAGTWTSRRRSRSRWTRTGFCLPPGQRVPAWSPDSKWIAYSKRLPNYLSTIFVYSLADGKSHQLTDGLSDARYPVFDKDGKYLYFTASTDSGPSLEPDIRIGQPAADAQHLRRGALEEPSRRRSPRRATRSAPPSPVTDKPADSRREETGGRRRGTGEADAAGRRVTGAGRHDRLRQDQPAHPRDADAGPQLHRPSGRQGGHPAGARSAGARLRASDRNDGAPLRSAAAARRTSLVSGVRFFEVSANGEKIADRAGRIAGRFRTSGRCRLRGPGSGAPALAAAPAERPAASRHLHAAHRRHRSAVRSDASSGSRCITTRGGSSASSSTIRTCTASTSRPRSRRYEPYLASVQSRRDLNYVFADMIGEITVGHLDVGGGDVPDVRTHRHGPARRRLHDRERPLPLRARLRRRELEPRPPGAADAAGRERSGGRVPAGGQRPRRPRDRQRLQLLRGDGRQERPAPGRTESRRIGRARGDRRAGRQRSAPAQPGVDRRQPPQGRRGHRRQGRLRLHARHGVRRAARTSPATTTRRSARRR